MEGCPEGCSTLHVPWGLFSGSLLPKMGLFHALKISKKGPFREVFAVEFGQLSVQWELFIKDLCLQSCFTEALGIIPRCQWKWKRDFEPGDRQFLQAEQAGRAVLWRVSDRMIAPVPPPPLICKFVVVVGQTYKGSSPWDFELNYHFTTWKPPVLKTGPAGMLLFCFDSWLPLHFPGKALIPHSPLLILKVFSHSSLLGFEKRVVRSTNERYAAFKTAAAHFCICVK